MRTITAFVCAISLALTGQVKAVIFPRQISLGESLEHPLDETDFATRSAAFAKAISLSKPYSSGPFELRVSRTGVRGDGVAYVIAAGRLRSFRIHRRPNGLAQAVPLTNRRIGANRMPVAEVKALKEAAGHWLGCSVEDGEMVMIDASLDGVVSHVLAYAPTDCTTPNAVRITALLNAITVLVEH